MVVRMPWGGLRHAGPYHSQNTEPWFYRTAGLKIVVPSTPHDARALMASAVAEFALLLRDAPRDRDRWDALARRVDRLQPATADAAEIDNFRELVATARGLARIR